MSGNLERVENTEDCFGVMQKYLHECIDCSKLKECVETVTREKCDNELSAMFVRRAMFNMVEVMRNERKQGAE